MTCVEPWVRKLTEECFPHSMAVGQTIRHPDGRTVKVTDGQFWGRYGVSNFWYWREVMPDGSLSETLEHGYGWC
jgi:hypothetical protein